MNKVLTQLGYTAVDRAWDMSTVPPVLLVARPRQSSAADAPVDDGPLPAEDPDEEARLLGFEEIDYELKRRIGQNVKILPDALAQWSSMAIVAYSLKQSRIAVAWRVDRESGEVDSDIDDIDFQSLDAEWVFTGEIDTWRSVLAGTENLASTVLRGAIRYLSRDLEADNPSPIGMAQATIRVLPVLAYVLGFGAGVE